MEAWSGNGRRVNNSGDGDVMGDSVDRTNSAKDEPPPLKNGSDLRAAGYLIAVGSRTARFRRKHKNRLGLFFLLLFLLVIFILAICMTVLYIKQKRHKGGRLCVSKECLRSAANLAASIDWTADPCEDFNQFACGNWGTEHPRPDGHQAYDWFREKQAKTYPIVRDFLAMNLSNFPEAVQRARDMYTACMDVETLDKRGLKHVVNILETLGLPVYPKHLEVADSDIESFAYTFDWLETVIKIKTHLGMDVLIGIDIIADMQNSSVYRLVMGSPESTNPFPSFYKKKKTFNKKTLPLPLVKPKRRSSQEQLFVYNNRGIDNTEEEEKNKSLYKFFYAELMRYFTFETGGILNTNNYTDNQAEERVLKSADDYYDLQNDFYVLETNNTTEDILEITYILPSYTVNELQAHTDKIVESNNATPSLIWKRYLEGIFAISDVILDFETDKIIISDPDLKYLSLMAALVAKTPPITIELYIWMKVTQVLAAHTTTEIRLLIRQISERLNGNKKEGYFPSRSSLCANAVTEMMGMAVTYAIVDPQFLNITKPKIEKMLNEIKNALARLVGKAKWMDDNTKVATYEKIIRMKSLIGYPEWLFEDGKLDEYYAGIEIDPAKHLENMISIVKIRTKNALNSFRDANTPDWACDPTENNAFHTFQDNTITIPLVMIQYPFYDLGLESLNYGSLGAVLGHEITHGFDDFGRQFDKNGNLLPWWSNDTIDAFINLTQCFIDQYSSFNLPDVDEHVDGKTTLGENIADNGGVKEAYDALKEHLSKYGPEPALPGFEHFTTDQLFFLSYGNLWCSVSTKDSRVAELTNNQHSPQELRVRGVLQNNNNFARAWNCPPGSPMAPKNQCTVY